MVPEPNPVEYRGIQELERYIIFSEENKHPEFSFMHNDVSSSNYIVNNDRIVGLIGWEVAGSLAAKQLRMFMFRYELPSVRISLHSICQR